MKTGTFKRTPETLQKMSESHKGIHITEEAKLKISKKLKGKKKPLRSLEHRKKLSENNARFWLGKKRPSLSEETKLKISLSHKGKKKPWAKFSELAKKNASKKHKLRGILNHNWIKDRTKLKKAERKDLDVQYIYWAREIKNRDNWKCKLLNNDCRGRLESHHIFSWRKFPELRYLLTNGITLCHFHHPRGREEEKRMIPIFQELLSVSKE